MNQHQPTPIPAIILTIQSPYDYWAWWLWLELKGKKVYGSTFRLYPEDAEVVLKLMVWCVKDKETALKLDISLTKGIMLAGPVGRGKTSLMNLIRHILAAGLRHRMKPCREIAFDFAREGFDSLQHYTKHSFHPHTGLPTHFCFDDLGLELNIISKHYTDACNIMAQILLSRYDYFIHHQMLTHITTSLTSKDIEDHYGKEVRSRCREMFNFISFTPNSPEKRK